MCRLHLLPPRLDDFYFLTDPEEFIDSHFPDEEKWQLLDTPISLEEFERRVFKTSAFFTLGLRLIQPYHFHIVTGSASVFVIFIFQGTCQNLLKVRMFACRLVFLQERALT